MLIVDPATPVSNIIVSTAEHKAISHLSSVILLHHQYYHRITITIQIQICNLFNTFLNTKLQKNTKHATMLKAYFYTTIITVLRLGNSYLHHQYRLVKLVGKLSDFFKTLKIHQQLDKCRVILSKPNHSHQIKRLIVVNTLALITFLLSIIITNGQSRKFAKMFNKYTHIIKNCICAPIQVFYWELGVKDKLFFIIITIILIFKIWNELRIECEQEITTMRQAIKHYQNVK